MSTHYYLSLLRTTYYFFPRFFYERITLKLHRSEGFHFVQFQSLIFKIYPLVTFIATAARP